MIQTADFVRLSSQVTLLQKQLESKKKLASMSGFYFKQGLGRPLRRNCVKRRLCSAEHQETYANEV